LAKIIEIDKYSAECLRCLEANYQIYKSSWLEKELLQQQEKTILKKPAV
jgi:hypothetical protein